MTDSSASAASTASARAGALYAATSFAIWGLLPLYLLRLASVAPLEVMLHRSVWSLVFVLGLLAAMRRWQWLPVVRGQVPGLGRYVVTALLLGVNWWTYVWAVQNGRVVEASLGYFINPLVNVLLGVTVLHERLRPAQWAAVALAAAGVLWLTVLTGQLPWVSLVLALTFGTYGLLRKTSTLGPLEGLAVETLVLAPLVLPVLAWWTLTQDGALTRGDWSLNAWLLLGGPLSAIPLALFAAGARRLPLAVVGLVQYVSPTLQLLLGIWVFHEPFNHLRLVGFAFIWAALALLSGDALMRAGNWRPTMRAS